MYQFSLPYCFPRTVFICSCLAVAPITDANRDSSFTCTRAYTTSTFQKYSSERKKNTRQDKRKRSGDTAFGRSILVYYGTRVRLCHICMPVDDEFKCPICFQVPKSAEITLRHAAALAVWIGLSAADAGSLLQLSAARYTIAGEARVLPRQQNSALEVRAAPMPPIPVATRRRRCKHGARPKRTLPSAPTISVPCTDCRVFVMRSEMKQHQSHSCDERQTR